MSGMWHENIEFTNLMIFIYMKTRRDNKLNEAVDINGSKVFVENGQVKTVLSEAIQQNGYMTVEDAKRLTIEKIKKIYQQNNDV